MSLCCDGVRQEGTRRAGFSDRRDAVQTPLMFEIFQTTLLSTAVVAAAEIGDKTQVATVALAARYPAEAFWVVCGTTLGLMIADAPAVFIGNKLAEKISMKLMRQIAAAVFFILAVVAYLEA